MRRIVLLMPFFGRWPGYLPFTLQTCRHNPTVHWMLFSDCGEPDDLPENVTYVPMTLRELNLRAQETLGLPTQITSTRKICDLRPAFGVVFADHLADCDFWGHGDLDVVYGDLRRFLPDELLDAHDVVSPIRGHLAGHFTLYRNADLTNRLYTQSRDHARILVQAEHRHFDETCLLFHGIRYAEEELESMTEVVHRLAAEGRLRAFFQDLMRGDYENELAELGRSWRLRWEAGRLRDGRDGAELLYFHFQYAKERRGFLVPGVRGRPATFVLGEEGFSFGHGVSDLDPADGASP